MSVNWWIAAGAVASAAWWLHRELDWRESYRERPPIFLSLFSAVITALLVLGAVSL